MGPVRPAAGLRDPASRTRRPSRTRVDSGARQRGKARSPRDGGDDGRLGSGPPACLALLGPPILPSFSHVCRGRTALRTHRTSLRTAPPALCGAGRVRKILRPSALACRADAPALHRPRAATHTAAGLGHDGPAARRVRLWAVRLALAHPAVHIRVRPAPPAKGAGAGNGVGSCTGLARAGHAACRHVPGRGGGGRGPARGGPAPVHHIRDEHGGSIAGLSVPRIGGGLRPLSDGARPARRVRLSATRILARRALPD